MTHPTVTLATKTIHNPEEPRHFMRVKAVGRQIEVRRQGQLVARTNDALRLMEVGRDIYDPVVYLPKQSLLVPLEPIADKSSYCPLKGHASYFCLPPDDAAVAWAYEAPLEFADVLRGLVAFYPEFVSVTETGSSAP